MGIERPAEIRKMKPRTWKALSITEQRRLCELLENEEVSAKAIEKAVRRIRRERGDKH